MRATSAGNVDGGLSSSPTCEPRHGQAHQALEGVLGLLDERLELVAYTEVLRRLYGFWIGWEPQVAALLEDHSLFQPRRRLHLLASDLIALGLSSDVLAGLPRCPLVDIGDRVEALGSLYVMEGSTSSGGRVIDATWNAVWSRSPEGAHRFHRPGSGRVKRGGTFLSELEHGAGRAGRSGGPRRDGDVRTARVVADAMSRESVMFAWLSRSGFQSCVPRCPSENEARFGSLGRSGAAAKSWRL